MNERRLQELFDIFNVRYFRGKLPPHEVQLVSYIPEIPLATGRYYRESRTIKVVSGLSDNEIIRTLIHEMAHYFGKAHFQKFRNAMIGTGLKWAAAECESLFHDGTWNGACKQLKSSLEDAARDLVNDGATYVNLNNVCAGHLGIDWNDPQIKKSLWWIPATWKNAWNDAVRDKEIREQAKRRLQDD